MRNSIEKLSEHIRNHPSLTEDQKGELLTQLADIEAEVETTDEETDGANRVKAAVQMTSASTEEQSIPEQLEENLTKLRTTYPKTAAALGRIASTLSRMGI